MCGEMPSAKPQISVRADREQIDRWKAVAGGSLNSWVVEVLDQAALAHPVASPAEIVALVPSETVEGFSVADVQVGDPAKGIEEPAPRFRPRRANLKQPRLR